MSRLSASHHPVSNTRRHGNKETMMKSRKKRSRQPQIDEKKRTSDGRESDTGTITSKQIGPQPAPANRYSPAHHPTRRAGE